MPISLVITLLETFGPSAINLITQLIATWEANGVITSAQWASLTANLNQTAADRAKLQLTAAGIDPASAQGLAFLALVGK